MLGDVAALVRDGLGCVAREHPPAYAAARAALGPAIVHVGAGAERFVVELARAGEDACVRTPRDEAIAIRVTCDAAAIHALVAGELDVVDALLESRLDLVGDSADLERAAIAATRLLAGAVRCVSIEPLLHRLERLAKESHGETE